MTNQDNQAGGVNLEAVEAIARFICSDIIGLAWDGLAPGSIVSKGYEPFIYSEWATRRFQGGQEDVRNLARSILAALPAAGATEPDRVTRLESALLGAIEAIESLADDALGYNTMGDGSVPGGQASWPIKDELLHNLRNVLAASPPIPSGGEPEPVAWTDKNGLEFLARGYGIDVSAEAGTTGRTIPLFASPPKPSEAMVEAAAQRAMAAWASTFTKGGGWVPPTWGDDPATDEQWRTIARAALSGGAK